MRPGRALARSLVAVGLALAGPLALAAAPVPVPAAPTDPAPAASEPTPATEAPDDDEDTDEDGAPDAATPDAATPDGATPTEPAPKPKPKHKAKHKKADKADLPLLHEKLSRRWMLLAPIDAELAAGYASGWETYDGGAGLLEGSVQIEPQLRWRRGRFRLRLPLAASQRLTFGLAVPETELDAALVTSGRPAPHLEVRGAARVARVLRPGWEDYYQPRFDPASATPSEPTGDLEPTDRFGFVTLTGELGLGWTPSDALGLSLGLVAEQRTYDHDPRFDPVLAPTHLTPNDRLRLGATLRLRTEPIARRLHVNLSLAVDSLGSQYAFARDAGTGLTHAGLGGEPANPLQRLVRWTLAPDVSVLVPALKTRLSLDLRWVHQDDTFAGYYTYDAVGGTVALRVRPARDVKVELDYDLDVRGYTHRGYQPSASHAPLEDGDAIRWRVSQDAGLEVSWALDDGALTPFLSARWHRVDDSMPDYVPWVNPPGSPYAVPFDEAPWWTARVGVRLSL